MQWHTLIKHRCFNNHEQTCWESSLRCSALMSLIITLSKCNKKKKLLNLHHWLTTNETKITKNGDGCWEITFSFQSVLPNVSTILHLVAKEKYLHVLKNNRVSFNQKYKKLDIHIKCPCHNKAKQKNQHAPLDWFSTIIVIPMGQFLISIKLITVLHLQRLRVHEK